MVPKNAADGYYFKQDKFELIEKIKDFVETRHPGLGDQAEEEAISFVSKMSAATGPKKDFLMKLDSKNYWNIAGRNEFPTLYLCAKKVNEMVCSSAASERVWSIHRFIHSRLRNRLSDKNVEKLVFLYVNCAITDKNDLNDYIMEDGAVLTGTDYQEAF